MRTFFLGIAASLFLLLAGCETPGKSGDRAVRIAQGQAIAAEPPGDYYVGRRYYNPNYKFWGYIRRPGQPWSTAKLVMLNEKQKLAPDRADNHLGEDNNSQYRIFGRFTGDTVYEPPSNRVYPEFLLTGYELLDPHPPSIFPPSADLGSTMIYQPE